MVKRNPKINDDNNFGKREYLSIYLGLCHIINN
jgi:hypothetical protein